jgi:hypothetical protein
MIGEMVRDADELDMTANVRLPLGRKGVGRGLDAV